MVVDFGDDVSLVEKEVVVLSITMKISRQLTSTAMSAWLRRTCLRRDHYVVNRSEGLIAVDFDGHISLAEKTFVVNCGEGLMTVDFGDHVSLAEKEGAGMARR
ncbi:hypothetical protein BHE74_00050285 [Ensete ventricosum]|nr:hypothetical protein BHE74_00050285 [Ensete ventricosum]